MDTKTDNIHPRTILVRISYASLLAVGIFICTLATYASRVEASDNVPSINIKRFETVAEIIPFGRATSAVPVVTIAATTTTSSTPSQEIPTDIFARIPYNLQKSISSINEVIVGRTSMHRGSITTTTLPSDIAYIEVPERKIKRLYPVESIAGEDGIIRLSYPLPSVSATKRKDLPYQALGSLEFTFASTTDVTMIEQDGSMKFIADVFYTNFYLGVDGSAWQRLAPSITITAQGAHEIIDLEKAFETVRLWGRDNEIEPYIMVRLKPILTEKSPTETYRDRSIVRQIIPQDINDFKTSLQVTSADSIGRQNSILINTGSTILRHSGIIPIISSSEYRARIIIETSNTIGTWKRRASIIASSSESPHSIRYEKNTDQYIRITIENMSGDRPLRMIDPVQIIADGILLHTRYTKSTAQDKLYITLDPFFESSITSTSTARITHQDIFDADTISHSESLEKINAQISQPIDNPYVPMWLRDTYRKPQESTGIRLYNQYSPYKETFALGLFALTVILITIRIGAMNETKNKK